MMLDFRSELTLLLPLEVWRTIEFWECVAVAGLCLWQLVYDGKFAVARAWASRTSRLGLIVQIVFALAGMGDAFHCREPHVLFVGILGGVLMIQAPLFARWVYAGTPDTLD